MEDTCWKQLAESSKKQGRSLTCH